MKREEKDAESKYDLLAEHYHNWRTKLNPEGWIYNEHLEMPAMFELLGNVKGKKVLDFGCGTGIYTKILKSKAVEIKGFDISKGMLNIARKENPELDLRFGSGYKIPFNEKFDIVFASLVVGYLKDWDKMLKEVRRVLKDRGVFIFSIGNPITETAERMIVKGKRIRYKGLPVRAMGDYFSERKVYAKWKNFFNNKQVKDVEMYSYHKTYETIIRTILRNGFEIADYKDCFPSKKANKLFPKEYHLVSKIPYFCVWKVRKK